MPFKLKDIEKGLDLKGWGRLRWPSLFLKKAADDEIYATEEAGRMAGYISGAPSSSNLFNLMEEEDIVKHCLNMGGRYYWGTAKAIQAAYKNLTEQYGEESIGLGRITK